MEIDTSPRVTLETPKDRVVPVPVNDPGIAEPVLEVILISATTSPVGATLKSKRMPVVGPSDGDASAVQVMAAGVPAGSVTVCAALEIPALSMEIETFPGVTLETAKDRVVPVPVNAPGVAEPVPAVIVMSVATSSVGAALKAKLILVVGLSDGDAVQVMAAAGVPAASVTVCAALEIPFLLMEIDTVPALTLETAKDRVVPVPVNAPLVAEPVPEVIVMSVATSPVGASLKVKVMLVVVGLPEGLIVQVMSSSSLLPKKSRRLQEVIERKINATSAAIPIDLLAVIFLCISFILIVLVYHKLGG